MSKIVGRHFCFHFLILIIFIYNSSAQTVKERPKIGLALSGGGAKGFAHIGVLKVMEELGIPIDFIAGTSMGSVAGALYSIGYKANEIEKVALETDWADMLSDEVSRRYLSMEEKLWNGRYIGTFPIRQKTVRLPSGLIAGQKISSSLARLTWSVHHINDFLQLPIPFTCVATDIGTGEAIPIDSGFLPDAIRASMAFPTAFTPVELQGRKLVDGGLVRNLPAEDVKRMGADIVIGVDVSFTLLPVEKINSVLDIMTQSLSFVEAQSRIRQHEICDILIQPDISGLTMFSFSDVKDIINRGEFAAREMIPRLKSLVDSLDLSNYETFRFIPPKVDSIYIKSLQITGLEKVSPRVVLSEMDIKFPTWISAEALEGAISRVYSSQFFERVTYKLIPTEKGSELIVRVTEKSGDMFRFGLRYDSRFRSALLLNLTFRNIAEQSSALAADLELGNESRFNVDYFIHTGLYRRLGLHNRLSYLSYTIDVYQDEQRIANVQVNTSSLEILYGSIFSTSVMAGVGLRGEYSYLRPRIAPEDFESERNKYYSMLGLVWVDTFDRPIFPHQGHSITFRNIVTHRRFGSDATFSRHLFDWYGIFPVSSEISLLSRVQLGTSTREEMPLNHKFFLGGEDSFLGLKYQERLGDHLQALQLGLQYEVLPRRFVLLRWNVGNTSDKWKNLLTKNNVITGGGITFGAATPIGPLEFTFSSSSRHDIMFYFNLGYKF